MEETAGVIDEYVEVLRRRLAFDRALARNACHEIEDHLREAAAARPADDPLAGERDAVARFGDPRRLAAELAEVAVARGNRRVGAASLLVVAGAFAAMKLRLAWYTVAAGPAVRGDWQAATHVIALVDRCAFWTAALIGIGTWFYLVGCGQAAGGRRQRGFWRLCAGAAAALLVSVAADAALTGLRTIGADVTANLVPLVSMAVEAAGAGALVAYIGRLRARARATAALLDG